MKSFEGYLKKKLGDNYVLLAGGNTLSLNYVFTLKKSLTTTNDLNTIWSKTGSTFVNGNVDGVHPDGLETRDKYYWGLVLSFATEEGARLDIFSNCYSSYTALGYLKYSGIHYRTGWSGYKYNWIEILDAKNYTQFINSTNFPILAYAGTEWADKTHYHNYSDLRGSGTTANLAILSNGTADGWKLATVSLDGHNHSLSDITEGHSITNNTNWSYIFENKYNNTTLSILYLNHYQGYGAYLLGNTDSDSVYLLEIHNKSKNVFGIYGDGHSTFGGNVSVTGTISSTSSITAATNLQANNWLNIQAWPGYGEGTTGFWYNANNSRWEGTMSNMLLNGNTVYHTGNLPAFVTAVGVGGTGHTNELYYTLSGTNNYLTVPYASTAPWSGISSKPFIRSPLWNVSNGWFRIASFNKHSSYGGWSNHGVLKAWSFNSNVPVMFRVNVGLNLARPTLTLVMFTGWDNVNGIRKIRIVCNSSYTSTQTAYLEVYATQNGDNYYFEYEGDDITFLQSPQAITTLESALDTVYTLELLKDGIVANNFYGNASSASVWKTERTLTIGNTGKSVNGSGNVSWSLAEIGALAAGNYALSNHTHDQYFLSRGKATTTGEDTVWSKLGVKSYENFAPDGLTTRKGYYWGQVLSFPSDSGMRFDLWMTCYSSSTSSGEQPYSDGLYYRTGWTSNKRSWVEILDSHNYKDYMNPSLPISGNTIAVTVGGATSSYITVPFATNSTNSTYTNYLSGYYSGSFHPGDVNHALYSSWTGSYYKLVSPGGYKSLVDYSDSSGYASESTILRITGKITANNAISTTGQRFGVWTTDGPNNNDGFVLSCSWSNNKVWGGQLFLDCGGGNEVAFRHLNDGGNNWSSWEALVRCPYNSSNVATLGSSTTPVYVSGGVLTACSLLATANHNHNGTYVKCAGGDTMTGSLTVSGGSITTNNYLYINAWPGYGSGSFSAWYNGSTSKLVCSADISAPNFYTTSDRSKKQNISSFSEHIRKFQLKDTEKWHYGVIAQEVEEMFRDGEEGNMTVNYNSVLSYYVGQLENKVKMLEEKVRCLESQNK